MLQSVRKKSSITNSSVTPHVPGGLIISAYTRLTATPSPPILIRKYRDGTLKLIEAVVIPFVPLLALQQTLAEIHPRLPFSKRQQARYLFSSLLGLVLLLLLHGCLSACYISHLTFQGTINPCIFATLR